ncbi:cytochrome P450 [Methylobrevis pamukkalensis]|uniref:Fatty-acid peroxygenase n=1 Tax=Methylobrevis pamukkalensis TaxID=1439726 RepID=A0A1E3H1C1_9HYPH|nr:cytochrome P450 [Methylobrevis pamukkalensis]ODN70094.1 Fatty-acid peroxygenase [Methylobrevis pamukkalensis]
MPDIPRDSAPDATLALLREGYLFIGRRCDRLGSDIFATRLMLRRVICMRGKDAARLFYGSGAFTRRKAMPPTTFRLLQDVGSVQTLEGDIHRHRKAMFVHLLIDPVEIQRIVRLFRAEIAHAVTDWRRRHAVRLMDELPVLLARAAVDWLGIPRAQLDPDRLAPELVRMIESAGGFGPRTWSALLRRRRVEGWLADLVRLERAQDLVGHGASPFATICRHRDPAGVLLSEDEAVVETLNLLRPLVAVGRFIAFAVVELARHPDIAAGLTVRGAADLAERFCEEVRRTAPFFPFVGGVALRPLTWNGYEIGQGAWVLLDLYGTNHHPDLFPRPERLDIDRRRSWREQGFDFIPQGGGDTRTDHRCPGEAFTVALMAEALRVLASTGGWTLPPQDLSVDLSRVPAAPRSGVVLDFDPAHGA